MVVFFSPLWRLSQIAGRMRNKLYPMRLANYIDKNAQYIKDALIAGQDTMKIAQEANKARICSFNIYQCTTSRLQYESMYVVAPS